MVKAYNWLLDFDLIPENLGGVTKNQIKKYIKDHSSVHIMNNRGLMEICFQNGFVNTLIFNCAEIDQMGTSLKSTDSLYVSTLDFVYIYEYFKCMSCILIQ